jgi:hypothetical protein
VRLALAALLSVVCLAPAAAQNIVCPTRALGDTTNACASTQFVQQALGNPTAQISVAGVTITPTAASLNQALVTTQSFSGTTSTPVGGPILTAGDFNGNSIYVSSDNANATNALNVVSALQINHFYGGAAMSGARETLRVWSELNAASSISNVNPDYNAANFQIVSTTTDNGNGSFWATGLGVAISPASGTYNLAAGSEVDFKLTGAVPGIKWGYNAVSQNGDAQHGSVFESAFHAGAQTGGVGWLHGFLASNQGGIGGIASTGTMLATQGAFTMASVLDTSSATVTANWLNFLGASAGITGQWSGANGNFVAVSSVSSSPAFALINSTSDTNSAGLSFEKNRAAGNTLSGDQLGGIAAFGYASGAQQISADVLFSQAAASVGTVIPSSISLLTTGTTLFSNTMKFDNKAHLSVIGTAPTLTGGCNGAGSSISGTDVAGTVGNQTAAATSCVVTFANSGYTAAPRCTASGQTVAPTSVVSSTTTLTINFASTATAVFNWICVGA